MSESKYQLAIFDFDGTLVDTKYGIAETVNGTLKHFGFHQVAPERVYALIGLSLETIFSGLVEQDLHNGLLKQLIAYYRDTYDSMAPKKAVLIDGMLDALTWLYANGVTMAVATSKGLRGVNLMLDSLSVQNLFSLVIGDGSVANKKPHPEMVLHILDSCRSSPAAAVMIGDTIYDVKMGRAAGVDTCAVTFGSHSFEQLAAESPTYIVHTSSQLINALRK